MKLTRKHLRDLIIEEVSEKKTMVPSSIKNNYLAVSHDENEQNLARENRIPIGVIPHGYVVLDDRVNKVTIIVTHDDAIALSDKAYQRLFGFGHRLVGGGRTATAHQALVGRSVDMKLMKALGITHIVFSQMGHFKPWTKPKTTYRIINWTEERESEDTLGMLNSAYIISVDDLRPMSGQ